MSNIAELVISERFGWFLAYCFVFGLILFPVVYIVGFCTRKVQPEIRYSIFLALLCATVATPVLAAVNQLKNQPPAATGNLNKNSTQLSSDLMIESQHPAVIVESWADEDFRSELQAAQLIAWLPLVWWAGVFATSLFVGLGYWGTRRLTGKATPLPASLRNHLQCIQDEFEALKSVTVRISERVISPVLVGVVKPIILLPVTAGSWDEQTFRFVLLHEFAHVRRFDNFVNFAQRLVEVLLFFQPAVWLVSNWVRSEREVCCDRFVVRQTNRPKAYAQTLLRFAEQKAVSIDQLATSSMAKTSVGFRIRRLLRKEEPMKFSFLWLLITCVSILTAMSGLISTSIANDEIPVAAEVQVADEPVLKAAELVVDPEPVAFNSAVVGQAAVVAGKTTTDEISGVVKRENRCEVSPQVSGKIIALTVKVGDRVKKGQVIARIDSSVLEAEFAQLKHKADSRVAIKFAQSAIDSDILRLKGMRQQNAQARAQVFTDDEIREQEFQVVKSKAELEKATEDVVGAELAVRTKQVELSQYTIYAPIDGVAVDVAVTAGSSVRAYTTTMLEIVDPSDLEMRCRVPATQVSKLKLGTLVEYKSRKNIGVEPVYGTVVTFGQAGIDGSVEVICRLRNPLEQFHKGTQGTVRFLESKDLPLTQPADDHDAKANQ